MNAAAPIPTTPPPSPELRRVLNDLAYDALYEELALVMSLATSCQECAFRGDGAVLGIHLRQLRDAMVETIRRYRRLDLIESEKSFAIAALEASAAEATR